MNLAIKPKTYIYGVSFSIETFKTDISIFTVDRIVGNILYCYVNDPAEETAIPKETIGKIIATNDSITGYFTNLECGYIACYSAAKNYFENQARSYELLAAHMDYEIKELKNRGE